MKAKEALTTGDTVTISGQFKPRSFWEWLIRKPRTLQEYKVIEGFYASDYDNQHTEQWD